MSATATATMSTSPKGPETAADYRAIANAYFRRSEELTDDDLAACRRLMDECYRRLPTGEASIRELPEWRRRDYEELSAARKLFLKAIVHALRGRIDRTARSGDLVLTLDAFGDLFTADFERRRPARDRLWLSNTLETLRGGASRR